MFPAHSGPLCLCHILFGMSIVYSQTIPDPIFLPLPPPLLFRPHDLTPRFGSDDSEAGALRGLRAGAAERRGELGVGTWLGQEADSVSFFKVDPSEKEFAWISPSETLTLVVGSIESATFGGSNSGHEGNPTQVLLMFFLDWGGGRALLRTLTSGNIPLMRPELRCAN